MIPCGLLRLRPCGSQLMRRGSGWQTEDGGEDCLHSGHMPFVGDDDEFCPCIRIRMNCPQKVGLFVH